MKNFITLLLASLLIVFLLVGYSINVSSQLSQNIVRLHVIANSDSEEDQSVKLMVRDAILEKSKADFTKKSDVAKELDVYKKIAEDVIRENGLSHKVEVEYGKFKFPTKHYGNISLPAGFYDAVRVRIGKAEGKNWWCVMFPPLCFVDGTTSSDKAGEKLKELLSKESYDIITAKSNSGNVPFEIKFKIVEVYGRLSRRDKVYAKAGDE